MGSVREQKMGLSGQKLGILPEGPNKVPLDRRLLSISSQCGIETKNLSVVPESPLGLRGEGRSPRLKDPQQDVASIQASSHHLWEDLLL